MGQTSLWPSLSGVVRLHGVWGLAVVCGLFANTVGPFVCNVVPQCFSICIYCGLKPDMFVGPRHSYCGPLQVGEDGSLLFRRQHFGLLAVRHPAGLLYKLRRIS
jgi:hypothetical protein